MNSSIEESRYMEVCRIEFRILKDKKDHIQSKNYCMLAFDVPDGLGTISIKISRETHREAQIPVALFDSNGRMRVFKASEAASGYNEERYTIGQTASSGAIEGPVPAGTWKLVLYKRRFHEDFCGQIIVEGEQNQSSDVNYPEYDFSSRVLSSQEGWYRGELHVHSSESTGRKDVRAVLSAAECAGLDFIAITDHFTSSHWSELERSYRDYNVLCLQSMEVSGDRGHANIHGLKEWINPLVDDNDELVSFLGLDSKPSMGNIADRIHEIGGIIGINHPLSGMVSWRYSSFPIEKADIIDIWASPDGPVSLCYPTLYDGYLAQGYHLTAVGSSDSHDPDGIEPWKFGNLFTYVYADSLSQKGIINGLKRGRVYVAHGSSRMDFSIEYESVIYHMGQMICYHGGDVKVIFSIASNPSGNLFTMISGQLEQVNYLDAHSEGVWHRYEYIIKEEDIYFTPLGFAFIRLEFYEDIVKSKFWGMAYKDEKAMRLLSNPIWLEKEKY